MVDVAAEKTSLEEATLQENKTLIAFECREYDYVNKRLLVVKLAFDIPENTTYFIEIATSRLASVNKKSDDIKGYSFAIFHKFLFTD